MMSSNLTAAALNTAVEYCKLLFQLKSSESILEYERMAEIGFEKRDFRMVSCTVVSISVDACSRRADSQRVSVCRCSLCRLCSAWTVPWNPPQGATGSRS